MNKCVIKTLIFLTKQLFHKPTQSFIIIIYLNCIEAILFSNIIILKTTTTGVSQIKLGVATCRKTFCCHMTRQSKTDKTPLDPHDLCGTGRINFMTQ